MVDTWVIVKVTLLFLFKDNSLIDYVLAKIDVFVSITDFLHGKFSIFSDNSPVCFKLAKILILSPDREQVHVPGTGRAHCKSTKWKENNCQFVMSELTKILIYHRVSLAFLLQICMM